ncbi:MAG: DUF4012 domain-containing protein [bacterium]
MSARTFAVETQAQAVAIFGGPTELTTKLTQELEVNGLHAERVASSTQLEKLQATHDPDYLVIFSDFKDGDLLPTLQTLVESGQSHLILISPLNSPASNLPLPPATLNLIYSDYVGDDELFSPTLESWLTNIQSSRALELAGDGLSELSLLGINDLASLLSLAIFHSGGGSGVTLYLGNPTPISFLNLAYLIRTNLPFKINLSFTAGEESTQLELDNFAAALEKLNYHLLDSFEDLLKIYLKTHVKVEEKPTPRSEAETPPLNPNANTAEQAVSGKSSINGGAKKLTPLKTSIPAFIPLQSKKRPFSFSNLIPKFHLKRHHILQPSPTHPHLRTIVGRGLIIGLALYLGTVAFSGTIVGLSVNSNIKTIRQEELPKSNRLSSFSLTYLQANWIALTSVPGLSTKQSMIDLTLLLDAYHQALSALDTASLLNKSTQNLLGYIFGSGNADVAQVISLSRLQAEELYQKLSLLDGSLPKDPPLIVPTKYHLSYERAKAKLGVVKRGVTTTKAVLAVTPDFIGLGGRRKYAVLFQNNLELRATGGFIGSFAILSFENGKLYDMPIYDVYDSDGQLKGHVEPPSPIKTILGEGNWYLRDSNFDPDFPTSARRAEWFINKSLNFNLDGTIAMTIPSLSALLEATGPLEIPDYNETITGGNLSERVQLHAEVNFFPGSTKKKEFLSTVASALFAKLPSQGGLVSLKLGTALADSVARKDTLISLTNTTTNHVFQTLGWNGSLVDFPCPTTLNCHKDYAMVVDSNFGVNKANYFIKRNIEEVITLDQNLAVNHVLRLRYQNTATSDAWPAGTYKNYQRLYLPIGTTIGKIRVGDKELATKDYTVYSEHNRAVLSYLVSVPIKETVIVQIEYTTPQLPQENELLYTWYWQKQPGTSSDDSLTVYLNHPAYLSPTTISPAADLGPQQLKFDMQNDTDRRITVKFTK